MKPKFLRVWNATHTKLKLIAVIKKMSMIQVVDELAEVWLVANGYAPVIEGIEDEQT